MRFVLVKGREGMGNRILSLLAGMLYSQLSGRRLLVDWSDEAYSSQGENVVHSYFQSGLFGPADAIPQTTSVFPPAWRGRLHRTVNDLLAADTPRFVRDPCAWRRLAADVRRLDYQEEVVVLWSHHAPIGRMRPHFRGPYQHLRRQDTDSILRGMLKDHLQLQGKIGQRVEDFRATHLVAPSLGIHVRYTDRRARLDAIRTHADRLVRAAPGMPIFVATDNLDVLRLFERNYPGVVSTPKWYPAPGAQMHKSAECPDKTSQGEEALIDLYLLAGCAYLVLDETSSFSHVARLLAGDLPACVVNVERGRMLPLRWRQALWLAQRRLRFWPARQIARWRGEWPGD